MNLKEMGIYKEKIIADLVHDPNIVDVLLGDTSEVEDLETALFGGEGTGNEGCVYNFEYLPDVQENAKTFLCVEVVPMKTSYDSVTRFYVYVFGFCTKNIMQTYHRKGEAGTRIDILMNDVDKILNGYDGLGIGPLEWVTSEIYKPMTPYYGRVITYRVCDYRRPR